MARREGLHSLMSEIALAWLGTLKEDEFVTNSDVFPAIMLKFRDGFEPTQM